MGDDDAVPDRQDLDEDLMTGRPQNPQRKRVKFCPKCGSTNINFQVYYRPSTWQCLDCGYQGAFIIEDTKLAQKIREEFQKTTKE